MTDKTAMIDHIEGLLGADGSRELAERMFGVLKDRDLISFSEVSGYSMDEISEDGWLSLLAVADSE